MWVAPDDILNKLKCAHCELYVKNQPIFFEDDVGLLCEWCSSILPTNMPKYSRQKGLELLVPHIIFPCRYEHFGCPKRACNEQLQDHEDQCKFRHRRLEKGFSVTSVETQLSTPLLDEADSPFSISASAAGENFFPIKSESKDLRVEMNCTAKGNRTTKKLTVLKYVINIIADENKKLCVVNNARRSKLEHSDFIQPVDLSIEGAISLNNSPSNLYCNLKAISTDTLRAPLVSEKCKSCSGNYIGDKLQCGYGHTLCTSCKRTECSECAKQIEAVTTVKCENFGCLWRGPAVNLSEHEKDCDSAHLHCIFNECRWNSPELLMKAHVSQLHADLFHSGESTRIDFTASDKIWIMSAFNKLFICKYYNYGRCVDVIVELYSRTSAQKIFTYTIDVLSPENKVIKSITELCSIFNHSILDRCVTFLAHEVNIYRNNVFQVTIATTT